MKKALLAGVAALAITTSASATGPDGCFYVSKTREGFLNVREAPTMKAKIITKLHPADIVYADAYECQLTDNCGIDTWTHIGRVWRSSGDGKPQVLRGWVGSRFLKYTHLSSCFDETGHLR